MRLSGFLVLACMSVTAVAQSGKLTPALTEMINSERAFAKLGQERGFRESFMTFFAEDGIGFGPHPHKVKETLERQPPPVPVPPIGFDWAPAFGDISQAGDLGWDTGPVLFKGDGNSKPARHGTFFSVWKRQTNGVWRVVLDMGSETPRAIAALDARFQSTFRPVTASVKDVNVEQEIAALLDIELGFLRTAEEQGLSKAYQGRMNDACRVQRPGAMPVTGRDSLRRWVTAQNRTMVGVPINVDVSRSGDLGYAYGSYEFVGAKAEKGYYARVWKRAAKGAWQIVMDTVSPLPPGTPMQAGN